MAVTGHKIYIVGNIAYIDQIVDSGQAFQYEGLAKDCLPRKKYVDSTEFSFSGFNGLDETKAFPFAMLKDGNGDAWADQATFEAWATSNLGKPSAGDSALIYEGYLNQSDTEAPSVSWIGDDGGITMSYISAGRYSFDKIGLFTTDKTFFYSNAFIGAGSGLFSAIIPNYMSEDSLEIEVYNAATSLRANNELSSIRFQITIKQ